MDPRSPWSAAATYAALALAASSCGSSLGAPTRHAPPVVVAQAAHDCGAPSPGAVAVDVNAAGAPADDAAVAAAADAAASDADAAPRVLASLAADLDGDGAPDAVRVDASGRLAVNAATLDAPLESFEALLVVDVDAREPSRQLLLRDRIPDAEDRFLRWRLYSYDGAALLLRFERYSEPRLRGDGAVRFTQSPWDACGEARTAFQHEVAYALAPGGGLVERSRRRLRRVDCTQLAACPYVDVVTADGRATRAGEILRNLRGRDAYARQSLALGSAPSDAAALRVRLSEEKPETTFLDAIAIELAGVRVAPAACAAASPPAYCAEDGVAYRLRQGEALDLAFPIDARLRGRPATLWASGYYVPAE